MAAPAKSISMWLYKENNVYDYNTRSWNQPTQSARFLVDARFGYGSYLNASTFLGREYGAYFSSGGVWEMWSRLYVDGVEAPLEWAR